ncbi:MAG: 50S ribosomal protein L25 [Pedosphaera sp.]|nr:50S ribosomal protein L25 [Pedosphaera sp.]
MKSLKLNAFPRTSLRRKGSKLVRSTGRIPSNIYGKTSAAQNLEFDLEEFDDLIHAAHSEVILVDLCVAGDPRPQRLALVQDVQHHPLSGEVLHVDFHEVQPDEKITIRIPVESVGEAPGVKNSGGNLQHVLLKIKVRAVSKDLPDQITVDVSALEVGNSIHIGDLIVPAGVEILGDKHITVFAVSASLTEVATTEVAAPAAGDSKQPEMIKEKKEDAGAAKAPAKKK